MYEHMEAFRDAMIAAGVVYRGEIIPDGSIQRVHLDGDKPGSKNGWYLFHEDGIPAGAFGNWRQEFSSNWCAKSEREFTPSERAEYAAKMERIKAERAAELERVRAEARAKAFKIFDNAPEANADHPYLVRKKVKPHGVKQSRGSLVIPAFSADGTLQTLQFIDADGGKLFLKGGMKRGCYFKIGGAAEVAVIVAEGFATGASLHESTCHPVAVAFDAGNLKPVAQLIRKKFPDIKIILAADNDNDPSKPRNTGIEAAHDAARAVGGEVVTPPDGGDFNDLALTSGNAAVAEIVTAAANDNNPTIFDPAQAMVEEWVFVSALRKFVHKPTMRMVDVDAFNMEHLHLMQQFPQYRKMKPAEYLRRIENSEVVHDLMYLPTMWNGDPIFYLDGIRYLNTYNDSSVPAHDKNWQQHDAWKICLAHIQNMLPDDWEQLLHWMAHNVQYPGKKILWAPVIVGMPGDGKTATAKMLAAAMGRKHSQVVGTQALHSEFNGWAEGKCLSIFEEIRVPGHSRHDFMNKLKTLITNDVVDVVAKGKNSKNVMNTQNYIALSNFRDALALDPDDRRWGVFFTRFKSREEVTSQMDEDYWAKLNDYAVRDNPEVIRGWLLSIDVSNFDRNAGPQMTQAKQYMIGRSMSADAQSIQADLETGARGVSMNVVETKSLNVALRDLENRTIQTSRMASALAELKFEKVSDVIKWDERKCHIWVRKPFEYDGSSASRAAIRDALDAEKPLPSFSMQRRSFAEGPF